MPNSRPASGPVPAGYDYDRGSVRTADPGSSRNPGRPGAAAIERTTGIHEREWLLIQVAAICGPGSPEALAELVLAYPNVEVWRIVAEALVRQRFRLRAPLAYLRKVAHTAAGRVGERSQNGAVIQADAEWCWECGETDPRDCDNEQCPQRKEIRA